MKNLPNSASQSDIESWRRWAKQTNPKAKFSNLRESTPERVNIPQPQAYMGCSSCRRWR